MNLELQRDFGDIQHIVVVASDEWESSWDNTEIR